MPTKSATKPTARKTASTRSTAKPAAKRAPAKKAAKTRAAAKATPEAGTKRSPRVYDKGVHGFVKGTDQAKIADLLIKGGAGRADIVEKAKEVIDGTNRNGNPKPVGTMVSNVIRKLQDNGYVVKETIKATKPKA